MVVCVDIIEMIDEQIFKSHTDLQVENQTFDQDERELTNGDDYEQDFDCSQNNEVSLTINNDIDLEEKKRH